ncbi:MAG: N-6 DNA methylase [Methylococcaceae bacterium]
MVATNWLFFTQGKPIQEIWYWQQQLLDGVKAYFKTKPIQKIEFENLKAWWDNRVENEQAWKVSIVDLQATNYNLDVKNPHVAEVEHLHQRGIIDFST